MISKFLNIPSSMSVVFPCKVARLMIPLVVLFAATTLVGCSQGSYPLDIFYEMHYQPIYKSHEPPRLSVPDTAVAYYPPPQATSFANSGQHLYEVNCAMCHGDTAMGDGPVLKTMIQEYGYQPAMTPDLTADQAKALGADGIKGLLISGVAVMPNFSKLLNNEEMDLVTDYVVGCIQGNDPQKCN